MSSVTTRASSRTDSDELALFHRTLAELCRAEMPLPRAFRLLQADLRRGRFRDAVESMAAEVESGVPLGEAYARRTPDFPPLYRALVEAGMVSGDLPGVLDEISRHAARCARITARIRSALAYPLLTAAVVVAIGTGLAIFVMPQLWGLPRTLGVSSPWPVVFGAIGVLTVLVLGALLFAYRRGPRLPVLGRLRALSSRSSLAATLALLLRQRVPLPTALRLCAEATGDAGLRGRLHEMSERASEGVGLGDQLRANDIFEPTVLWLLEAAEAGGELPAALEDVADLYERRLGRGVERFTTLVTPLAEILVGIAVFVLVYSYIVPLFEFHRRLFGD